MSQLLTSDINKIVTTCNDLNQVRLLVSLNDRKDHFDYLNLSINPNESCFLSVRLSSGISSGILEHFNPSEIYYFEKTDRRNYQIIGKHDHYYFYYTYYINNEADIELSEYYFAGEIILAESLEQIAKVRENFPSKVKKILNVEYDEDEELKFQLITYACGERRYIRGSQFKQN